MQTRKLLLNAAALGALHAVPGPTAETAAVVPYTAEYAVEYRGRNAARAEFQVTEDAGDTYVFSSTTRTRGLYRLLASGRATETSRFRLAAGRIQPMRFDYGDGSRKGEDNFSVTFDAADDLIRIDRKDGTRTLPLEDGMLDRGSLQVSLMLDLAACRMPGPYRYVDDDGVSTYEYTRLDDSPINTGIGPIQTVRFEQYREGSSRRTILALARDYAYVPVRIEQLRNGETETVFSLESLTGISPSPSNCSGFR